MVRELTICIVHYNKIDKLRNTINYIEQYTSGSYLVKILNNGYINKEIESYFSYISNKDYIEIILNKENIGCSPGRNKLLQNINTPFVMTLDDDMYVCEGWFENAKNIFESNSDIGIVGFPFTQQGTKIGGRYISLNSSILSLDSVHWDKVDESRSYIPVDDVPGGAMLMRNEVLSNFEWDSRYKIGSDDIDKGLQLYSSKWDKVMMVGSEFTHDVSSDKDYQRVRRDYRERRKSYQLLRKKWGYRYPIKKHIIFNYFFALPWPIMSRIEEFYKRFLK